MLLSVADAAGATSGAAGIVGILFPVVFLATAAAYASASFLFFRFLVRGDQEVGMSAPRLVAVGAALHAVAVVVASYRFRQCPVEGIQLPLGVAAVLMCGGYAALRRKFRIDVAGVFLAPLALVSLLAFPFGDSDAREARSVLLPIHVTLTLLGFALFGLAFSAASLYLVQERLVKIKRVDGLSRRLPPLDALDRAEHRFLLAGFPLLTLGILTGTFWVQHAHTGSFADVFRTAVGYLAWIVIASVLLLRGAAGWRGHRAAYGTIAGFGFALVVLMVYFFRSAPRVGSDALEPLTYQSAE